MTVFALAADHRSQQVTLAQPEPGRDGAGRGDGFEAVVTSAAAQRLRQLGHADVPDVRGGAVHVVREPAVLADGPAANAGSDVDVSSVVGASR